MKKLTLSIFFILLSCQVIYAAPVMLTNSEYHVWGNVNANVYEASDTDYSNPVNVYREYDETSSSPLSGSADFDDYGAYSLYARSTADLFSLDVEASSFPNEISTPDYNIMPVHSPDVAYNDAFAEGTWDFYVLDSLFEFEFDLGAGFFAEANLGLYDLTTSTELFYGALSGPGALYGSLLGGPDELWFSGDTISMLLDISHEYRLIMYAEAESAGDSDYASISTNLTAMAAVPEPTSMMLLSVGLLGAVSISSRANRRKHKD